MNENCNVVLVLIKIQFITFVRLSVSHFGQFDYKQSLHKYIPSECTITIVLE